MFFFLSGDCPISDVADLFDHYGNYLFTVIFHIIKFGKFMKRKWWKLRTKTNTKSDPSSPFPRLNSPWQIKEMFSHGMKLALSIVKSRLPGTRGEGGKKREKFYHFSLNWLGKMSYGWFSFIYFLPFHGLIISHFEMGIKIKMKRTEKGCKR